MLVPEALDGTKRVPWFKAGAAIFDKSGIQYLGVPGLINAKSIVATLLVQVCLCGWLSTAQDLQAQPSSQ